jgi:hypothetical protein
MACCVYGFSRDAQVQATVNTSCCHKEICTVHVVMEITNGQPWQISSQNSVFWRGAECHCQVPEFLLNKHKIMIKSKFRALNAVLNGAEYAIIGKEDFSFLV